MGGEVFALANWDPDGAGPAPPALVIGGDFNGAGTVYARNIVTWNPTSGQWSALGDGLSSCVRALAVLPTGELVAAGDFDYAGGIPAAHIAKWSGSVWSPLGTGMERTVHALAVLSNGDLVAAGDFGSAGGVLTSRIAKWSNGTWGPLGQGMGNLDHVYSLLTLSNGDLLCAGEVLDGVFGRRIVRWDGSAWNTYALLSSDGSPAVVYSMTLQSNGDLYVAGYFDGVNGVLVHGVARRSATTGSWSSPGVGLTHFTITRAVVALPSEGIAVGGWFSSAGAASAMYIAAWQNGDWRPLGTGMNNAVNALLVLPQGDLVAGGRFSVAGNRPTNGLARWVARRSCLADFDCSGSRELQDLYDYLSAWLGADPSADVENDQTVTLEDLFLFLSAWLGNC